MHNYFENLYQEIGADKALLKELVQDFINLYEDNIIALEKAIYEKNFNQMDQIAHKLKGSSLNFNFMKFTEAAKEIEFIGKDHKDHANPEKYLDVLKFQIDSFISAYHELKNN